MFSNKTQKVFMPEVDAWVPDVPVQEKIINTKRYYIFFGIIVAFLAFPWILSFIALASTHSISLISLLLISAVVNLFIILGAKRLTLYYFLSVQESLEAQKLIFFFSLVDSETLNKYFRSTAIFASFKKEDPAGAKELIIESAKLVSERIQKEVEKEQ